MPGLHPDRKAISGGLGACGADAVNRALLGPLLGLSRALLSRIRALIGQEQAHSNSNRPGSAESGPIIITLEILEARGPDFRAHGPEHFYSDSLQ